MPESMPLSARVRLDQLRLYAETHRNDAFLESVIVFLVAGVMLAWIGWAAPAMWAAAYLPALLGAHRLFARFLGAVPGPQDYRRWLWRIGGIRLLVTLLWASIPFWGWQQGNILNNGLVVILLVGSLGATAALSTAHWRLYLVDTAPVALALVAVPLLDSELGLTYSALALAFVSYLVLPAVVTHRNTAHLIRLRHEKDRLITDLAGARDTAQRANAAKTRFLASMSHELRTPLNGMMGMAQLLRSRQLGEEEAAMVDVLHSAGEGLVTLVNDLLDLSNIEEGRIAITQAPYSPRVLLDTVAGILRPTVTAKGLSLRVEVGDGLPDRLVGDEARLRQVVLNLAYNGVKFTDHGGVTLALEHRDGWLRVTIQDTGIGIAADRLAELEEGVVMPEPGRGGAGLGLAISRGLIRAMGGGLELAKRPSGGTEARFSIPAPPAPAVDTGCIPSNGKGRCLSVLVVEDDATNRLVLGKMLERLGHDCLPVETAEAALDLLARQAVDVVLMDVRLPGLDGVEATRRLRASPDRRLAGLPVVAMTANLFPDDIADYWAVGMVDILPKPIRLSALTTLLDRIGGSPEMAQDAAVSDQTLTA
ncbi:response regulator [Aerophototrophica crusticola]|uniref:histidine kinase n=1 Tax=Aerophototrophica crusticola TaxID=1709002 RepID=A0A858R713_9PROT|nr:response regulator [Rhodospirillaceae bacterium B3]